MENLIKEERHQFDFILVNALEISDNSSKIFPIIYKKLLNLNASISPL